MFAINFKQKRFLFWSLASGLLFLAVSYFVLINGLIFNTVARRQLAERIVQTQSEVSRLEGEYFALARPLDREFAAAAGFQEAVQQTIFVEQALASEQLVAAGRWPIPR